MYAIHTTPGFVIESRPWGDAGKIISIFARDLGLVSAAAQGIRLEKSKLRYHAQDCSLGSFSLVKGKEFWRLTSARSDEAGSTGPAYAYIAPRLASVLKRLMPGEEPHPDLYDLVEACLAFSRAFPSLDPQRLQVLESVAVFSMLRALGYIAPPAGFAAAKPPKSLADLDAAAPLRADLNRHINTAFRESHL